MTLDIRTPILVGVRPQTSRCDMQRGSTEPLQTVPLSRTQQEILLRSDLLGSQIYVIGLETWINGPLREDLLDQATRDVIATEPMLRAMAQRDHEGVA